MTGGPKRLPFTVPSLVFSALKVCFSSRCILLFHYGMMSNIKSFN